MIRPGVEDARRLRALTRSREQAWLTAVTACVREQDAEALAGLTAADSRDFRLLGGGAVVALTDEFGEHAEPPQSRAARASIELAEALLSAAGRAERIDAALDLLGRNGIASAGPAPRGPAPAGTDAVSAVLRVLHARRHPAAPFSALLALVLAGRLPAESGAPTLVPVLFERPGAAEEGVGGILRLVRLEAGPPGLHPDPRRRLFAKHDAVFAKGLRQAWLSSPLAEQDACVVWSLREKQDEKSDQHLHVDGSSLAAAFAVALDDIAPPSRLRRLMRWRTLDPNCALTGGIEDAKLTEVTGYPAKLKAAADRNWRVVYPDESKKSMAEVQRTLAKPVVVTPAATVPDAVRSARGRVNRRLLGTLALAAALTLTAGISATVAIGVSHESVQAEREQRAAASLASQARALQDTDPRLASLAALAGYELVPSVEGAAALLEISAANAAVVRAAPAHSGGVTAVTSVDDILVSAGAEGTIATWSRELEPLSRLELELPVAELVGSGRDDTVVARAGGQTIVFAIGADGSIRERARWDGAPVEYLFVQRGSVDSVFSSGMIRRHTVDGALLSEVTHPVQGRVVAAAVRTTGGTDAGASRRVQTILATTQRTLYQITEGSGTFASFDAMDTLPATPTALAAGFFWDMVVGTERGGTLLSEHNSYSETYPLGGSERRVHDIVGTRGGDYAGLLVGGDLAADRALITAYFGSTEIFADLRATAMTAVRDTWQPRREHEFLIGTPDGRIVLVSPPEDRVALHPDRGSNMAAFTPEGDLIQTVTHSTSNNILGLRVLSMADPDATDRDVVQEYSAPEEWGDSSWYINTVAVDEEVIVAGGLAPGYDRGSILVWDRASAVVIASIDAGASIHQYAPIVNSVRLLGGGERIAGFNVGTGELGIWSIDGTPLASVPLGGGLGSLGYHEDTDTVLALTWPELETMSADHVIVALDGTTGEALWSQPAGRANRMSVNPADGSIALLDDRTLHVLHAEGGDPILTAQLPEPGHAIAWSPDGSRIAVGAPTGRVFVLDGASLSAALPPLAVADGLDAVGVAWSPDAALIAVVTLHRDDTRIYNGSTQLLRTDTSSWASRMCDIAGSGLSRQEWRDLVGDAVPFRELCVAG